MNAHEEVANSLTHLIGASIAMWMSYYICTNFGWSLEFVLYSLAPIWMFLASSIYHIAPKGEVKYLLRKVDHISIYFTIFFLTVPLDIYLMRTENKIMFFVGVITLSFQLLCTLLGMIFKILTTGKYKGLSTTIYIVFGWTSILPVLFVLPILNTMEIAYAFGCGIIFTIGGLFYSLGRIVYFHAIWHILCILGILCHYGFIINFFNGLTTH